MRIAVVGLAHSHPYSYTKILQRMGHEMAYVWDDDAERLERYAREYGVTPVADLFDIPQQGVAQQGVDGVIVATRLPERIDHVIHCLEKGLPVYSGKPLATSEAQIERLSEAVRRTGTPLLATSVLRYAPALQRLRAYVQSGTLGTLVSVRAVSAHAIKTYMAEPHTWQDDPTRGGGTLLSMGVHALEMLSVVVGSHFADVQCRTGRRVHLSSLSEDVALLTLEWQDGLLGTVEIVGGVAGEYYGVELFGSEKVVHVSLPSGVIQNHQGGSIGDVDPYEEFGYVGTIAAFLTMCETRVMPVALEESVAIARTLLAARASAQQGVA
jgi:predicted dehydrogenase